jgi:hypothetical protein
MLMKWKAGKVPVFFEMNLSFKMVARGSAWILPDSTKAELVFGAEEDGIRFSWALSKGIESKCSIDRSGAQTVFLKLPGKVGLNFREAIPLVSTAQSPVQYSWSETISFSKTYP